VNIPLAILGSLVALIFAAGGAWVTVKGIKRDLNGLGSRLKQLEDNVKVLLLVMCAAEERKWLAEQLLRK
jgi:uncharacterized protein YneF (UPF0154 family)